jgi:hypothetical protein
MTKLTLVEGLPKYDGINEANAIANALNVMKKGLGNNRSKHLHINSIRANTKQEFTKGLEKNTDFLHISSHGERDKNNTTYLYVTNGGCVYPQDIEELNIQAKVVFLNACLTSRKDMANAFLEANNPNFRFFIAPRNDVTFDEAFIVSLLFYRNAFLNSIDLRSGNAIFKALNRVYKLGDIKTKYSLWRTRKRK